MNVPAWSEDPTPSGDAVVAGLRQVQKALRAVRTTENASGAVLELSRLLLEVLYPLVDSAENAGDRGEPVAVKAQSCADAVASVCEFERWRPEKLTPQHIARIVEDRQRFWSQADKILRELITDVSR